MKIKYFGVDARIHHWREHRQGIRSHCGKVKKSMWKCETSVVVKICEAVLMAKDVFGGVRQAERQTRLNALRT